MNVRKGESHVARFPVGQCDHIPFDPDQIALQRLAVALDRGVEGHAGFVPGPVGEILFAGQRTVNARRTHFQPAVFKAVDLQCVLQLAGHGLAVFHRHEPIKRWSHRIDRRLHPRQINGHTQQTTRGALNLH